MKKFLFAILMFIPIMCNARVLHVDNLVIPLHAEKFTTPSLNIAVDNTVLYAPMVPWFIWNRVHVGDNGIVYSVCMGEKTHVGNHWFVGDCLVDADDGVYLKIQNDSTNGYLNHINTGIPWEDSDRVLFTVGYAHSEVPPDGYDRCGMFFSNAVVTDGDNFIAYYQNTFYQPDSYHKPVLESIMPNITMSDFISSSKQTFDMEYYSDEPSDIAFGSWTDKYWSRTMKWYDVSIYNDGEILRRFIPVPAGMVIGGYTVPENGMWDVVKQQFYGNAGTGEFIYGVDE